MVYRTGDLYGQKPGFRTRSILQGDALPSYERRAPPLEGMLETGKTLSLKLSADIFLGPGLYYIGRQDDVVMLSSGLKVDAPALEGIFNALPDIQRTAILPNAESDALVCLVELANGCSSSAALDSIIRANVHLAFEKRLSRGNIQVVNKLPVTTKSTLHRKRLKKIIREAGKSWRSKLATTKSLDSLIPELPKPDSEVVANVKEAGASSTLPPAKIADGPIRRLLQEVVINVFNVPFEDVADPATTFASLGLTSLASVRLASAIQQHFGVELTTSKLYGLPTIAELGDWIIQSQHEEKQTPMTPIAQPKEDPRIADEPRNDMLAITGATCRFPGGVDTLAAYWDALLSPKPSFARAPPPSRWPTDGGAKLDIPPMGWIEGLEHDDPASFASFFELRPSDVKAMTPNARIALQMAYGAIEDAGIRPKSLDGKPWGVFSCVNDSGWRERQVMEVGLEGSVLFIYLPISLESTWPS